MVSYAGLVGVLDRLLGRTTQPSDRPPAGAPEAERSGRFAPLPEDNFVKVVGESHYQEALRALVRHCVPAEDGRPGFPAVLVREPENPFDPNAIAVHGPTGPVGYLPRENAARYSQTFAKLREAGYDGGSCGGLLNGGDREPPNYGVVLTLAYPEVCEMHLGISRGASGSGASRPASTKSEVGTLRGAHFTSYVDEVKTLRRDGRDESAELLLLELLDVNEAEAAHEGWGVAPWYYEQLAIIYRQRKDPVAEVAVLERFAAMPHAPGASPPKLLDRLKKARELAEKGDVAR
jgi:hypothetical protein